MRDHAVRQVARGTRQRGFLVLATTQALSWLGPRHACHVPQSARLQVCCKQPCCFATRRALITGSRTELITGPRAESPADMPSRVHCPQIPACDTHAPNAHCTCRSPVPESIHLPQHRDTSCRSRTHPPLCKPMRICTRCPAELRNPAVASTISRAHVAQRTATVTGSSAVGQPPIAMNASPARWPGTQQGLTTGLRQSNFRKLMTAEHAAHWHTMLLRIFLPCGPPRQWAAAQCMLPH